MNPFLYIALNRNIEYRPFQCDGNHFNIHVDVITKRGNLDFQCFPLKTTNPLVIFTCKLFYYSGRNILNSI